LKATLSATGPSEGRPVPEEPSGYEAGEEKSHLPDKFF
jgi:hypothetical protein